MTATPHPVRVWTGSAWQDLALVGPQGPAGPPGPGTPSFHYNQGTPASTWSINHALGKYPAVTIITSAGDEVEGDIHYVDANNVTLSFAAPFAGDAYFN